MVASIFDLLKPDPNRRLERAIRHPRKRGAERGKPAADGRIDDTVIDSMLAPVASLRAAAVTT